MKLRYIAAAAATLLALASCSSDGDAPADDTGAAEQETGSENTGGEETSDDAGADADGDAAGEIDLVSAGKLIMCTNPPYPPFEDTVGGEVVGLDVDIVNEIAVDLGLELEVLVTPFEGIQSGEALNSGQCDVGASGMTITDERAERMDFTDPYFDANQALLVMADSDITGFDDLEGRTVGVQSATTGDDYATDNGLDAIKYEDLGLQREALRAGTIDAVINDIAVVAEAAADGSMKVVEEFNTGESYGIAVRQGNTGLLDAANATLARIMEDGTYADLYEQWLGVPLS